ncbi:hypothetical protein SAMN04487865_104126 [Succinivibrio dextrinosolvens]|uniref:Biopterin-dependent aromatic amino acid hydroxylase family profile domain-containing protein n=1 Tax=Succinivibrio dextrinosolvens TaxID=83771 RepID=A0A662ZAN2_9GAMM|nr:hypothetical protein SAMN04487865_104126 [Succinivibrio dextrinosolvens]
MAAPYFFTQDFQIFPKDPCSLSREIKVAYPYSLLEVQ